MTPAFYRTLACLGILAALASCSRATYSFSGQDIYLLAPTVAVTTPADLPTATDEAAAPTPGAGGEANGLARRAQHRAAPAATP
ncbi:hypothetical protein E4631_14105 [Hymenobacter sp. UV11]|uniref:hypothetical protein n=1 Tax=Hymenobacter sp. UV11 TaxID=1849735 RepID=UPI0010615FB3|nr:hypothetical protein [Hymenobacter sp. UV11]TDN36703.1 hypothetical protein A8B98_08470 [Hymenobacter sp. UV11]TFZ66206.1 hypothetical protein E4631_14105 [Hymenobacter sp. UV11]